MPIQDLQPMNADGQISAGELVRLGQEVRAHDKVAVGNGLTVSRNGAGFQIGMTRPIMFWAKITSNNGASPAAHAWTEQGEPTAGPPLTNATDARTGTTTVFPAFALDGGITATGHVVRLYLSNGGDYYLFDPGMA